MKKIYDRYRMRGAEQILSGHYELRQKALKVYNIQFLAPSVHWTDYLKHLSNYTIIQNNTMNL